MSHQHPTYSRYFSAKSDSACQKFYEICRAIDMHLAGEDPKDADAVKEYDEIAAEYISRQWATAPEFKVLTEAGLKAVHGVNSITPVNTPLDEHWAEVKRLMDSAETAVIRESWARESWANA